jgi:SPP1 gp7 family putative phage head morphogenesis protein
MLAQVRRKNERTWQSTAKRMGLEMRALVDSPGVGEAVRERIDANMTLIKSLMLDSADKVAAMVRDNMAAGSRADDLAARIADHIGDASINRARMIARTEVSKAGTALTRARALDVGSSGYIWRTARDGSTRPSHRAMEGVYVPWDKPAELDGMRGHAGEFPNCRCYPEPVIPRDEDDRSAGVYRPSLPTQAQEKNLGKPIPVSRYEREQAEREAVPANEFEKALDIRPGPPLDIPEAASGANPNFQKGKEYQINCQRCVPTYELRRRGYNVEAQPVVNNDKGQVAHGMECFDGAQPVGWPRNLKGITGKELEEQLNALPDGARAAVFVCWGGPKGHTFVCEKLNGALRFIDPQSGQGGSGHLTVGKKFGFYRMDNLKLREKIDWKTVVKKA